jgi:hypothetical protein
MGQLQPVEQAGDLFACRAGGYLPAGWVRQPLAPPTRSARTGLRVRARGSARTTAASGPTLPCAQHHAERLRVSLPLAKLAKLAKLARE